jgi:hypothetical protein
VVRKASCFLRNIIEGKEFIEVFIRKREVSAGGNDKWKLAGLGVTRPVK